jgi:hypothetical protein
MFKNTLVTVLFISFSGLISCNNPAVQLQNPPCADCSTPSKPDPAPASNINILFIVEIYDFNQRLVSFGRSDDTSNKYFSTNITPGAMVYSWDGKDMDGILVDPGKYLEKWSIIDYSGNGHSQTICGETYIAP